MICLVGWTSKQHAALTLEGKSALAGEHVRFWPKADITDEVLSRAVVVLSYVPPQLAVYGEVMMVPFAPVITNLIVLNQAMRDRESAVAEPWNVHVAPSGELSITPS